MGVVIGSEFQDSFAEEVYGRNVHLPQWRAEGTTKRASRLDADARFGPRAGTVPEDTLTKGCDLIP